MQLCEWLRRAAAYSVAVRYQRQLGMADSAGRMINLAQLLERAFCQDSLNGQLVEQHLLPFCVSDIPRVHKGRSVGPFYE